MTPRRGRRSTRLSDWWKLTAGPDHEQGDLLFHLPVATESAIAIAGDDVTVTSRVDRIDAVILTQTCDLANAKLPTLLVARVLPWSTFAEAQFDAGNQAVMSKGYINALLRGDLPPLALLHGRTAAPELPWSVVDFRVVYSIQRSRLDDVVAQPGSKQRLRLVSPYKEHFAQAFARFFMRVGLPHDATGFVQAGRQQVAHLR